MAIYRKLFTEDDLKALFNTGEVILCEFMILSTILFRGGEGKAGGLGGGSLVGRLFFYFLTLH